MEFALCKRGEGDKRIANFLYNCYVDTLYTKVKGVFDGPGVPHETLSMNGPLPWPVD